MDKKKAGNTVFIVSLVIVAVMAIWSVVFNDSFTVVSNAALISDHRFRVAVSAGDDRVSGIYRICGLWQIRENPSGR